MAAAISLLHWCKVIKALDNAAIDSWCPMALLFNLRLAQV